MIHPFGYIEGDTQSPLGVNIDPRPMKEPEERSSRDEVGDDCKLRGGRNSTEKQDNVGVP